MVYRSIVRTTILLVVIIVITGCGGISVISFENHSSHIVTIEYETDSGETKSYELPVDESVRLSDISSWTWEPYGQVVVDIGKSDFFGNRTHMFRDPE